MHEDPCPHILQQTFEMHHNTPPPFQDRDLNLILSNTLNRNSVGNSGPKSSLVRDDSCVLVYKQAKKCISERCAFRLKSEKRTKDIFSASVR